MVRSFPWLVANDMIECVGPTSPYETINTSDMTYKRFYDPNGKSLEFEVKFFKKSKWYTAVGLNEIIHSCSPEYGIYLFYSVVGEDINLDAVTEARVADSKSFEWKIYPFSGVAELKKVVTNDDPYYVKWYVKFNSIALKKDVQTQLEVSVMERKLKGALEL